MDYQLHWPGHIRARAPCDSFGRKVVKSPRFNSLLASTAVAVALTLSSHAGVAQQAGKPAEASIPMPDTTLPPPLTLKDIEKPSPLGKPTAAAKDEPQQTATPPTGEPPRSTATAAVGSEIGDKLRELITGRQFDRLVARKADRSG